MTPIGLYERFVLPKLIHLVCGLKPTMMQRAKVAPLARGRVLEVGFGSGLNLPFYDRDSVQKVWALEPSTEMWEIAQERVRDAAWPVERLAAGAEEIPLADGAADSVLVTYTICTLPDVSRALGEMARVLKPAGELIFCEHGAAPDAGVRRWQDRLNPAWKRFSGGCHLNRPIPALLEKGGFRAVELSSMYIPGLRFASFNYWGRARGA